MDKFAKLAEAQISKAQAEGQLTGLKGEGKPLPPIHTQGRTEAAMEIGTRIMAEAGALPEEITIQRELAKLRAEYAKANAQDKTEIMRKIANAELRHNIAREARIRFFR